MLHYPFTLSSFFDELNKILYGVQNMQLILLSTLFPKTLNVFSPITKDCKITFLCILGFTFLAEQLVQ
jgi:hypothetical protein